MECERSSNASGLPLPQFLVCGAARSATTWLYQALDSHPDVYLAKPVTPEPKFFHLDAVYAKGIEYYSRTWFSGVPESVKLMGEKSTAYIENPQAAQRIKEHLPQAKLLFLLRDPVERAYCNYLWSVHNGLETLPFDQALDSEEERTAKLPEKFRQVRPFSYFDRGLYARQLQRYFDVFPANQILCIKSENVGRDPNALMSRVFAFLDIPEPEIDFAELGKINATPEHLNQGMTQEARQRLGAAYEAPNTALVALLGDEFAQW